MANKAYHLKKQAKAATPATSSNGAAVASAAAAIPVSTAPSLLVGASRAALDRKAAADDGKARADAGAGSASPAILHAYGRLSVPDGGVGIGSQSHLALSGVGAAAAHGVVRSLEESDDDETDALTHTAKGSSAQLG